MYKWISKERRIQMGEWKIGDSISFVDGKGVSHSALVIHVSETCLNIAYVDLDSNLIKKESVPFYEEGMSGRFYRFNDHLGLL